MADMRMGPTAIIQFVHSAGTMTLHSKYRTAKLTDTNNLIETTSGADAWKTFIGGIKEWSLDVEYGFQGTDAALGTADFKYLANGATGTVNIGPLGSTTNSFKMSGPVIVESRSPDMPYDGLLTVAVTFRGNGALTDGAW